MISITCSDAMVYAYLSVDSDNYELERLARTSDKNANDYKSFVKTFQTHAQRLSVKFSVSSEVMKLCGIAEPVTVNVNIDDIKALVKIKNELAKYFSCHQPAINCINHLIVTVSKLEKKIQ